VVQWDKSVKDGSVNQVTPSPAGLSSGGPAGEAKSFGELMAFDG
jgi:hypothetical protein